MCLCGLLGTPKSNGLSSCSLPKKIRGFPILYVLMFKSLAKTTQSTSFTMEYSSRRRCGGNHFARDCTEPGGAENVGTAFCIATKGGMLSMLLGRYSKPPNKTKMAQKTKSRGRGIVGGCSKHFFNWTCFPRSTDQLGRCWQFESGEKYALGYPVISSFQFIILVQPCRYRCFHVELLPLRASCPLYLDTMMKIGILPPLRNDRANFCGKNRFKSKPERSPVHIHRYVGVDNALLYFAKIHPSHARPDSSSYCVCRPNLVQYC